MDTTEVLVVGAGPTGLTLACALLQQGIEVRVVDRADGPATTSRANVLHARGAEVLDRVGALGPLRERGQRVMQLSLHLDGRAVGQLRFGAQAGRGVLVLPQSEVEAGLRARFRELGGSVEWGTELLGAHQDGRGVTAVLTSGTARAGWVAGCDGAHSAVRRIAGCDFPGAAMPDQWVLADVRADFGVDRGGTLGWFHPAGMLFAMPMRNESGDLWRLIADAPADGAADQERILDELRSAVDERSTLQSARIREATWASGFRIHRRLAGQYRSGRCVLAGDAAHIHSPLGGQGMNTGVGDAENLAWKLALVLRGRAGESLVDTYREERRPLATGVVRGTSGITRLALARGPVVRRVRDRALSHLLSRERVQLRISTAASQLRVSYRKGPLGSRGANLAGNRLTSTTRPRPGDRVPDLGCTTVDGTHTRLHAELRGHWALLGGDAEQLEVARKALGDGVVALRPDGQAREARLVRPDAHLAWRGRTSTGLRRWLGTALGSPGRAG